MTDLLATEGVVRVRVAPDEVARAAEILTAMTAPDHVTASSSDRGWLSVQVSQERASELNRALGQAGIYASGLEAGNDLEELFLSLTRSEGADPDGTFAGRPAEPAGPTDWAGS
jgi:hypothetical protein